MLEHVKCSQPCEWLAQPLLLVLTDIHTTCVTNYKQNTVVVYRFETPFNYSVHLLPNMPKYFVGI